GGRAQARGHVPVDVAHLIPRHVRTYVGELDAPALENGLALAGEHVLDQMAGVDLEAADAMQNFAGFHARGTLRPWRAGAGLGDSDFFQDPTGQLFPVDLLGLGLVGDMDAMAQHVERDLLHVLRRDVGAPVDQRVGARGLGEIERGARARAVGDEVRDGEPDLIWLARRLDDVQAVVLDLLVDVDLVERGAG